MSGAGDGLHLPSAAHDHYRAVTPGTARFCPLCGGELASERLVLEARVVPVCTRCRFIYFLNQKVVAGTLVEADGRVLLTRRTIEPGRGLWTFPGGFVDFGETASDAAIRETREESGLEVELTGLHGVYSFSDSPVIVVYRARETGGALRTCHENDAFEWVAPDAVPWERLAFRSTREALGAWQALRARAVAELTARAVAELTAREVAELTDGPAAPA